MFLSTVNALCPRQDEFNLLGYSWYPAPLKRHFVRLALTTRPDLANFAKYPAIHWFTPYGLKKELQKSGFACFDRFDLLETNGKGVFTKLIVRSVRAIPFLRWLGFLFTTGTVILAVKPSNGKS